MLTIRPAELDDAPAIAQVHVETWRSAYGDIVPRDYLDSMTVANRTLVWVRLLERAGSTVLVSEDHNRQVIGFVSGCSLRHRDDRFEAEIAALYVMARHQRDNHGRRLFLAAANRLATAGLKGLFVWVLADNPARLFYEKLGGSVVAETVRTFSGKPLREVGYGWEEIPRYGD